MAHPQNLLPLFEAALDVANNEPANMLHLAIPPLPADVAAAFGLIEELLAPAVAGAGAEDDLDYDASTVPVDIDEYYDMADVFADDLPGALVNAVQEARPALDLIRSREDVSNLLKNRFYYAIKRLFFLFLGNPENIDGWRNTYGVEMGNVLPHLPAAVIGDLAAPLEAFQETFQPAVDAMLGLRQANGSYVGYPDLYNDLYIYIRRMLRIQDPMPEEDVPWPIDAQEENPLAAPVMPVGHPQLLPNGGDFLPEFEEAGLPHYENHQEDNEPP
jgi:hypothetical protein